MQAELTSTTKEKSREKKAFAVVLGKRIRESREKAGLTQEELALKAGYYRTYIGHIETGTYSPAVHTIWRLAKAMNRNLSDLLEGI